MIVKDNLEFHAAELRPMPGTGGVLLTRLPSGVRNTVSERGRWVMLDSVGTEIRFVTDAPRIHLYLAAFRHEFGAEQVAVRIFRGNFRDADILLLENGVTRVTINRPPAWDNTPKNALRKAPGIGFAPDVVRIMPTRGGLVYCGIDTFGHDVRPPMPEEKPARTCLCYGSSITNSSFDGYPVIMGQRLGMDIINLGFSGSCRMEPQVADWIVKQAKWDVAALEMGINVLGWTPEEFAEKTETFLKKVLTAKKPVFLLTMFPASSMPELMAEGSTSNYAAFNDILRKLYRKYRKGRKLYLIEGTDVLDDLAGLGTDLVHPYPAYGTAVMGLNLARMMQEKLKGMMMSGDHGQ